MQFKILCPECTETKERQWRRVRKPSSKPQNESYINLWIPPDYQQVDISKLPRPSVWETLKDWNGMSGTGLLLYGPTRKGKSRIAYGICSRLIRSNVRVECYDCRTFRASVERRIQNSSLWDWYEGLQTLPVLMLDDVGKFKGIGKRVEEELYNVVKLRMEYRKPIIITSNSGPDELKVTFGDSIAAPLIARLGEMCEPVYFGEGQETGLTPDLFGGNDAVDL